MLPIIACGDRGIYVRLSGTIISSNFLCEMAGMNKSSPIVVDSSDDEDVLPLNKALFIVDSDSDEELPVVLLAPKPYAALAKPEEHGRRWSSRLVAKKNKNRVIK